MAVQFILLGFCYNLLEYKSNGDEIHQDMYPTQGSKIELDSNICILLDSIQNSPHWFRARGSVVVRQYSISLYFSADHKG
jgi:predicted AAA+ superfamily ATPase